LTREATIRKFRTVQQEGPGTSLVLLSTAASPSRTACSRATSTSWPKTAITRQITTYP
jgi:hypothetical protein